MVVPVEGPDGPEVPQLMGDVRHAVVLEHQPRLQLAPGRDQLLAGDAVGGDPCERVEGRPLDVPERHAVGGCGRHEIEERVLGRQDRRRDTRRQAPLDQRPVQARAPLRRRRAEARPEVQALGAREDGVEHQHRKEVRICRPPARDRPSFRYAVVPSRAIRDAPLALLFRLRRGARAGAADRPDAAELLRHPPQHVLGLDVADDHQRGVVRDVELAGSTGRDPRGSSTAGRTASRWSGAGTGCALKAAAVTSRSSRCPDRSPRPAAPR